MSTTEALTVDGAEERRPSRILVVDDVAENRDLILRRFQRQHFIVDEADCGLKALSLIEEGRYDAILLDIMMPDMDGIEVLRHIRAKHSSDLLPVIMVTGKTGREDVVNALESGANDYLTKPVDFSIALARVRGQVERKRATEGLARTVSALKLSNDRLKQEISGREQADARSEYLMRYDALTGVGNRTLLKERLSHAISYADRNRFWLSVVYLDIDNFKLINESLGYASGDKLLATVAGRLVSGVRESDIVARLSGDDFGMVLLDQSATSDSAAALIKRVQSSLSETIKLENHSVNVSSTVGVATYPDDGFDPDTLLANAEIAMSRAKMVGPGACQFFRTEFNVAIQQSFRLQEELRRAIQRSEFVLHYQPQIDLDTGAIVGVEALVRWMHPSRGVVSPIDFIPVAEQTGLIGPIGSWVLREACRQNKAWQDAGLPPVVMSVNVSPQQFHAGGLVGIVIRALEDAGLDSQFLELELTESMIMQDVAQAVATMRQLQSLGVQLSIDDFGTGYSSLAALRTFPVSRLKIDKSFISGLDDKNNRAVASAVIWLARKLDLRVIAEGVETDEQVRFLSDNGCYEMQGFRFYKPVPAGQLIEILKVAKTGIAAGRDATSQGDRLVAKIA
jgi:diguanylate cyclase (GGDEF)-like protein